MARKSQIPDSPSSPAALALTNVIDGSVSDDELGLTVAEVAKKLSRSPSWVKMHAAELGGQHVDGSWRFPTVAIERRSSERVVFSPGKGASEMREGERDARVLEALGEGMTIAQIVVREKVPVRIVAALREEWLKAAELDRKGVAYACSCGAPSVPATARCERCAARSTVLTDAQRAVLAGEELTSLEAACSCCGVRKGIDALDRICSGCRESRVTIVAESGRLRVVLRTANGPITLRALGADESRQLALAVLPPGASAPAAEPIAPPPAPVVLPAAPDRPTGTMAIVRDWLGKVDEVQKELDEARERLSKEST